MTEVDRSVDRAMTRQKVIDGVGKGHEAKNRHADPFGCRSPAQRCCTEEKHHHQICYLKPVHRHSVARRSGRVNARAALRRADVSSAPRIW